ncbi:MAG: hypothetical protein HQK71_10325 [Desulfamplus sp.]|nr:hypothetical protein [Desulfamplus sp.]
MIAIDKAKLINNRLIFSRICTIALIIAIIGILDTLISLYRKPANDLDIIAGRSLEVVGKVYGNSTNIRDIGFSLDSAGLSLIFDNKLFSGYWLGEDMWRAELKADSSLPPGRYKIKILFHDLSNIKPDDLIKVDKLSTYTVNVYSDAKALRQSDLSFIKRFTGISPWLISIVFFPIVLMSGALVFIISGKLETQMAQNGFAEVYRVIKHDNGFELFFGLGTNHGLTVGDKIKIMNESGETITEAVANNIGKENSSALAAAIKQIRPGFMVAKKGEV